MKEQDLRDKFKPYAHGTDVIDNIAHTDNNIWNNSTDQCVQIAKDYAEQEAIKFIKFTQGAYSYSNIYDCWYLHANTDIHYTTEQLYQLFKNRENER